MSGIEAWSWLVIEAHKPLLKRLKRLLYKKASKEQLERFLLKVQHDPLFVCPIVELMLVGVSKIKKFDC